MWREVKLRSKMQKDKNHDVFSCLLTFASSVINSDFFENQLNIPNLNSQLTFFDHFAKVLFS